MRKTELENWVLNILDKVKNKHPIEDSTVELKSTWIDPQKAARLIAGHANAARGDSILWIVGVDENNGVEGADYNELSTWFSQVAAQFENITPYMENLNITYEDKTVVALLFETDRAPFVVKNPIFGKEKNNIEFEVPWREGNSTRSARRSDLIKILIPKTSLPQFEVLNGYLEVWIPDEKDNSGEAYRGRLELDAYLSLKTNEQLTIPYHRCNGLITFPSQKLEVILHNIKIDVPKITSFETNPLGMITRNDSNTMQATNSDINVFGAGKVKIFGDIFLNVDQFYPDSIVKFIVNIQPDGTSDFVRVSDELKPIPVDVNDSWCAKWVLKNLK